MQKNEEPRLYFSALPNLSTLVAFRAVHSDKKMLQGIQPTCCRDLLFSIPEILVSPAFDNESLFIISELTFSTSNEFATKLEHCKVKLQSRIEVDTELFQYCFTFTLIQKLAPNWNKVGNFFVKGENFLQVSSKLPAITFEISVTNKICLAMMPFLVKMTPPDVEDFMIDFQPLWKFKHQKFASISCLSIQDPRCFVLPSLRKGRLHSITHQIPNHAPFKSFQEMKDHWKLSYGYMLPSDDCQLYYNVCFFGDSIFSYPEWCIRHNEPLCYWRCNQDEICNSFFTDLNLKMANLFTNPLKFTKNSLFWQKSFPVADHGNKSCLSKFPQDPSNKSFSKINNDVDKVKLKEPFQYTTVVEQMKTTSPITESNIKKTSQNSFAGKCNNLYEFTESSKHNDDIYIPDSPLFDQVVPGEISLNCSENQPMYENGTLSNNLSCVTSMECTMNKLTPSIGLSDNFTAKKQLIQKNTAPNTKANENAVVPESSIDEVFCLDHKENEKVQRIVPQFGKIKKNQNNSLKIGIGQKTSVLSPYASSSSDISDGRKRSSSSDDSIVPSSITQSLTSKKVPLFHSKQPKTQIVQNVSLKQPKTQTAQHFSSKLSKIQTLKPGENNTDSYINNSKLKKTLLKVIENTDPNTKISLLKSNEAIHTNKKVSQPFVKEKSQACGIDLARQILSNLDSNSQQDVDIIQCTPDSTVPPKKIKSKPKVQDIDVEVMARSKNLSKVNILTLKTWLKEKQVKFKSTDKKEELVKKVDLFLGIIQ